MPESPIGPIEEGGGPPVIAGVATSIAAFIGRAWRGPVDRPVFVGSFSEFTRLFGGVWRESMLSIAVKQFFENGGTQAIVVRVASRAGALAARPAIVKLEGGEAFRAADPGTWGLNLTVAVDRAGIADASDATLFNLTVTDDAEILRDDERRGGSGLVEQFTGVSVDPASPRFVGAVLEAQSQLLRLDGGLNAAAPSDQTAAAIEDSAGDGAAIGSAEVTDPANRAAKTGLYALDHADLFNLLCIPPYAAGTDNAIDADWLPAAAYCRERRALLIVDAPAAWTVANAVQLVSAFETIVRENAAMYFPRALAPDPADAGALKAFAPCGMVAGVMARTDAARGVWKAPAGTEAPLAGVAGLSIAGQLGTITDDDNDRLSAAGVNSMRTFPRIGRVVWGARMLAGTNAAAPERKYVPLRRLAFFIEESLTRGTRWVVFEPNNRLTWTRVVEAVTQFLTGLFRQGAFTGAVARDCFFVTCGVGSTMTQDDVANGRLILEIGYAPFRPAEFVILRITQKTMEAS